MENRAWAPIIILACIVAGTFVFYYFDKVDKANAEFQNAKLITSQAHESIRARQELIQHRQKLATDNAAMLQKLQAAETRLKTAEQLQADADKKQRSLEGDIKYWTGTMPVLRQKVWQAAAGTKAGDVALQSGKVLKNAEIRKVEEKSISLIHSEGIGTIALDELPRNFLSQFDLGDNSLVRQFEQLQESLSTKASAPQVAQTPTAAAPATSGPSAADEIRFKELKFKQADYKSKIEAAKQNKISWDKQATQIGYQIESNKSRGVPTTKLREEHQKAQAQSAANASLTYSLEADLRKLEVELDLVSSKMK